VLILYADCDELKFFANNKRVEHVTAMGDGVCRLFDQSQKEPFLNLRSFPMQKGRRVKGKPTVYASVQEPFLSAPPPKFRIVPSFNYEAAAA
jgi:hypothetical protein